jgi:G:T-mismatch repair DNA endonuclease (very short patch repair protein)
MISVATGKERIMPKDENVRSCMRRQSTQGTRPERALVEAPRRRGFPVEQNVLHLLEKLDILLPVGHIAIFVHECFWHGRRDHFVLPQRNR